MASTVTWVLEPDLMPEVHARLRQAALAAGQTVLDWQTGMTPPAGFTLFHGSLQIADELARDERWSPGAYCATHAFTCSAWYPAVAEFLVHERWALLPASELVKQKREIFSALSLGDAAFIRPDSPLKPFSGRVVSLNALDMESLDHGFYYDDPDLLVIVAPVRKIGREWRYIVHGNSVISGSEYIPAGRKAGNVADDSASKRLASMIAGVMVLPDPLYTMDIAEVDGELRLVELNPFSGADLYACDLGPVTQAAATCALHATK